MFKGLSVGSITILFSPPSYKPVSKEDLGWGEVWQ